MRSLYLVKRTETIEVAEADPVLANASLPLRATYYPLGFPLEVYTNSQDVLAAADQSWRLFRPRFAYPPLSLRLGVSRDPVFSNEKPQAPVCRVQKHLLCSMADPSNFFIADLNAGFSFGWITPQTAASSLYLRYHFLEAAALCMVAAVRAAPLHAACVVPAKHGMLLCGDSGAGKSSLAFAGARSGWTYVCDDASYLLCDRKDRMVVGNCHQFRLRDTGPILFPELQGRPITPRAAGKPSIEIPTADLPQIATADSACVRSIVFLNRDHHGPAELFPLSKEKALQWFHRSIFSGTAASAAFTEAIRSLLGASILELRYTDLNDAIQRLNTFALQGR